MTARKLLLKQYCAIGAVALVGVYTALSPSIAWPLYSTILFRPNKNKHDDVLQIIKTNCKITPKDVRFQSTNGKMLRGCYFESPNSRKVVLFSSGKGGNMSLRFSNAWMLLRCGLSVFMYDYQGYGESEGTPSIDGTCEDVVAAYDYLIEHENKSGEDVIAFGDSFGCGPSNANCKLEQGYSIR